MARKFLTRLHLAEETLLSGTSQRPTFRIGNQTGVFSIGGDTYYVVNLYYDGTTWRFLTTGPGALINLNSTGIHLFTAASGSADAAATLVEHKLVGRYAFNAQTGTTYTVVLADESKMVTLSNASAITVTLPQDSSVAIPIGGEVHFVQIGAGQVTFAAGSGATVNSTPGLKCRAQYSAVTAIKRAANTWLLMGDLAA